MGSTRVLTLLRSFAVVAAVVSSAFTSACDRKSRRVATDVTRVPREPAAGPVHICTLEAWPSVIVALRDPAGRAIARGATVEIRSPERWSRTPATEAYDTLHVGAGNRSAGTFTIRASKPGYVAAETSGVHVPGGPCGATGRVTVPMTMRPVRSYPGVREIIAFGSGIGLGPGIYSARATVYVNAADGVDTSVVWASSNPSVATADQHGMITSRCLQKTRTTTVIAISRADRRKRAHVPVEVWGDPQTCPSTQHPTGRD